MKNIFKFLPFIACTTFLVASCGKNNPQKNEVNVSLQSTMLKIDKVTTEKK